MCAENRHGPTMAQQRLEALHTTIKRILKISGAPGLSIAVIHHGETIHTAHFGYRDVERKLAPNSDTRYGMNSMSKAVVAQVAGMLHEEGVIDLEAPVKTVLTEFESTSLEVQEQATAIDLLSHRTGITNFDAFWLGNDNSLLVARDQAIPAWATLKQKQPFRTSFLYNNWGYEIVRELLERATGKKLDVLLQERVFGPLNMTRSSTSWDSDDDNVMLAYGVLEDLTPTKIGRPQIGQGQVMEAAGGIKTTLNDLICLYKAFMKASIHQFGSGTDSGPETIFKSCRALLTHHSSLPGPAFREQGYAAGWIRAQLPGQLGRISFNGPLGTQPTVGKDSESRLDFGHNGFMPGCTSNVHLLLESETAIIVLQNSSGTIDSADIIAQLLIEHLFAVKTKNDYIGMAETWSRTALSIPRVLRQRLDDSKVLGTKRRGLKAYVGKYHNAINNYFINVFQDDDTLMFSLQGSKLDTFVLRHHHSDVFEWLLNWNGLASRGRVIQLYSEYFYTFHFEADETGRISSLGWAWDPNFGAEREVFQRSSQTV